MIVVDLENECSHSRFWDSGIEDGQTITVDVDKGGEFTFSNGLAKLEHVS